jgi:hypothetical protein
VSTSFLQVVHLMDLFLAQVKPVVDERIEDLVNADCRSCLRRTGDRRTADCYLNGRV